MPGPHCGKSASPLCGPGIVCSPSGRCCDAQCIGGCDDEDPTACFACKNITVTKSNGRIVCQDSCPPDKFEVKIEKPFCYFLKLTFYSTPSTLNVAASPKNSATNRINTFYLNLPAHSRIFPSARTAFRAVLRDMSRKRTRKLKSRPANYAEMAAKSDVSRKSLTRSPQLRA